ncbi:MAG: helix-turn-helix domain-containing protein [Actinomycetota bacterium]
MAATSGPPTTAEAGRTQRIDAIRRAAIPVFAAQGYRGTSMADLAVAAGVSRPALYQYFDDRADLFRAAFGALLNDQADASIAELAIDGSLAHCLDGYLQRSIGDGWAGLAATAHGDELMETKHEFAEDVAQAATRRAQRALRAFLRQRTDAPKRTINEALDLLILAPAGLKSDRPSIAVFRRRLSALAGAAAALLATSQ